MDQSSNLTYPVHGSCGTIPKSGVDKDLSKFWQFLAKMNRICLPYRANAACSCKHDALADVRLPLDAYTKADMRRGCMTSACFWHETGVCRVPIKLEAHARPRQPSCSPQVQRLSRRGPDAHNILSHQNRIHGHGCAACSTLLCYRLLHGVQPSQSATHAKHALQGSCTAK